MQFNYEAAISGLEIKHAQDVFNDINLGQLQTLNNEIVKFAMIAISTGVLADLMQIYIDPTQRCCYGWIYRRNNITYAEEIRDNALKVKNNMLAQTGSGKAEQIDIEQLKVEVNQVLQAINAAFDPGKLAKINPVGDFARALTAFLNKYWQIRYPLATQRVYVSARDFSVKGRFSRTVKRFVPHHFKRSSSSSDSVQLTETSPLMSGQVASPAFEQTYVNQTELLSMIELCRSIALAQSSPGIALNVGDHVWCGTKPGVGRILSQNVMNTLTEVGR